MKNILKDVFGFNKFRPHQEEVIKHILEGKDVFVVMPTGGGKSLCFQLPAKILPGITVVISPLISLMKDQVDGARENNIAAMYLNSSLAVYEMAQVYQYLREGSLDILYVSPERLANESFYNTLKQLKVSLFAVDEAHCISEWGHDFRPDYMNLSRLVNDFPDVPIAAFTATATMKVQTDIISRIGLRDPLVIRASFNRPNLYYHVTRKENANDQVLEYVQKNAGKPGIIYRTTRKSVDQLSEFLVRRGIKALPYHAGLSTEERDRNQDAFNRDEADVICATIAFGMGIDKNNARYVIHADMPRNMEGYYQETGRVGRDGEYAECVLLFSPKDIPKIRFFIDQITDPAEKKIADTKLYSVMGYASHNVCRRKTMLAYFGETYEKENCGNCDICKGEHARVDISRDAQIIMSAIMRTGQRFGIVQIIDIVTGANTKRIQQYRHDEIKTYGAGKDKPKKYWSFIMNELLSQEAVVQTTDQYPVIRISDSGKKILYGREKIFTLVQPESIDKSTIDVMKRNLPCDEVLFEKLRVLRRNIAGEHKVPPYIIFSDKSLREMASYLPLDLEAMSRINGVGELKLKNYGEIFIGAIKAYKDGKPDDEVVQVKMQAVADSKPEFVYQPEETEKAKNKRSRGDSLYESLELFKEGLSVQEVAEKRGLAVSTITGHLEEWLKAGVDELEIDDYIEPEKRQKIEAAFKETQDWRLGPVVELLGDAGDYEEARIVRGWMQGKGVEFEDEIADLEITKIIT